MCFRLFNKLSHYYCVSYVLWMDGFLRAYADTHLLTFFRMLWLQCSLPFHFDWRNSVFLLKQTILINLLKATNFPYFTGLHFLCTQAARHPYKSWLKRNLWIFSKRAFELCKAMIQPSKSKFNEGTTNGRIDYQDSEQSVHHNLTWAAWSACVFCILNKCWGYHIINASYVLQICYILITVPL